jgi:6-pyruvoyl-tetrahydropterin synthase
MFTTRVTRQIEAAHHNGPEWSKCHVTHGHSWRIVVSFEVPDAQVTANEWGWGIDFSVIKEVIDRYDHQDLNEFLHPPSAENLARTLFNDLRERTGIKPEFVRVEEGAGNEVEYSNKTDFAAIEEGAGVPRTF